MGLSQVISRGRYSLFPCMDKDVCHRQRRWKWVCEYQRTMSDLNEWQRRKTVICVLWMRENILYTSSLLNEAQNELVYGISWGTLQGLRSLWRRTVQTIVSVWRPTGSASSPSGVYPGPRGGKVAVSLAPPRWCAMRDQDPAPSGPWSGSAYWTQVSEPVLLRASPVWPCIRR